MAVTTTGPIPDERKFPRAESPSRAILDFHEMRKWVKVSMNNWRRQRTIRDHTLRLRGQEKLCSTRMKYYKGLSYDPKLQVHYPSRNITPRHCPKRTIPMIINKNLNIRQVSVIKNQFICDSI